MKRIISAIMAFTLALTMLTGVNLSAWASEVTGVSLNLVHGALSVYEGCSAHTESDADGDYYVYDLFSDNLLEEGSSLVVDYDDMPSAIYECVRDYWNDEDYDLVFKNEAENETINLDDIEIVTNQSASNKWELGGTYTATAVYRGQSADFSVQIVQNPVESVQISYKRSITLAENSEGHWVDDDEDGTDDWFLYYPNRMYLNDAGVSFVVNYTNEETKEFFYKGNDWLPTTEDGEPLDDKYLGFGFSQMENHLTPEDTNRKAAVDYYGKGYTEIPVSVVRGDMDSGSISENKHRKILFIGNENHTITFTPSEDGVYLFEESLADKLVWEHYRFTGELLDENKEPVESLSYEMMIYVLEGGKTYTLNVQKVEESGPLFEFLSVRNVSTPMSVEFSSEQSLNVYDGDFATGDAVFREGNQLEVTFSDGQTVVFTCNDECEYVDDNGVKIYDYRDMLGLDFDCDIYSRASATGRLMTLTQTG
ncbi:MAG: hypothetical protein IKF64_04380 [Eubacterium sp.]|nr:hypothetical protein [Eubacterium sp.]